MTFSFLCYFVAGQNIVGRHEKADVYIPLKVSLYIQYFKFLVTFVITLFNGCLSLILYADD